jgi:DNA-directed RNA polymerase subunit RPC12/RpoP
MSADHAAPDDADAADTHDPYNIVPEGFCDAWNADTIPQALANAESAPSTTDPREQQRCPHCLTVRLTPLPSDQSGADWECTRCTRQFDEPLPSEATAARQAAHAPTTDREAAQPRCRACLSTRLYPAPEAAPIADRWACLDCGAGFDQALPSRRATERGDVTRAEKAAIGDALGEDVTWTELRKREVKPVGDTEATTLPGVRE